MRIAKEFRWRMDRQVNLAMVMQLVLLASLIVGQWMDTQRRLDRVGYDVVRLGEQLDRFGRRLDAVGEKTIAHDVRLSVLETNATNK